MAFYFCSMKNFIGLLIGVLALISCETNTAQNKSEFKTVTVQEFQQTMKEKKDIQLIDVRTSGEYTEEHLENAINMDYNSSTFATQISTLDKNKPTFIYCLSGGRSNSALNIMKQNGFTEVYNMAGGILEWKGNQLPLTRVTTNGWKGMTKEEYQKIINDDIPTLVDFKASWCGPCKQLKPILEDIKKQYAGKINIVEIDIDQNKSLADDMNIRNIPLLIYHKKGKVEMNIEGFVEKADLIKTLKL